MVVVPFKYKNLSTYDNKKKWPEELIENKLLNRACREVPDFSNLLYRFERALFVLGRSPATFNGHPRHLAAMALHFGKVPTYLDPDQVPDYLFMLQKRSKFPSEASFKHTDYGLRFLLKTVGFPYEYLRLPEITRDKRIQVALQRGGLAINDKLHFIET